MVGAHPDALGPDGGGASASGTGYEVRELGFSAGGRQILAPLTLRLEPGRFYGLIGHNGSGKSTLLKLLGRQEQPTRGEIRFGGVPLEQWSARGLARQVAYLPQSIPAATGLTVRELVGFGRYPWHGPLGRPGAEDRAQVEAAMRLTGTARFADRLVDTLSGGERQRAWIAMLVAQAPGFVLLDEPISALDLAQQVEVLRLLHDLAGGGGADTDPGAGRRIGVVAVLHDINMAARFCDELIALHGGALQRRGPPAEIMREDVLAGIFGVPMSVLPHPATGGLIALPR